MPLYEFACDACGARFSRFTRSVNAEVPAVCERCGGAELRRLVSSFAVRRKGGVDSSRFDDPDYLPKTGDHKELAAWSRHLREKRGGAAGDYHLDEQIERLEKGERMNEERLDDLASFNGTPE
jgi:putative FmdB family regulatory protein